MADSILKSAASAAPAAFATLTDSGTLAAGLYDIEITTVQAGTVDSNRRNMSLALGSTGLGPVLSIAEPTTVRFTIDNPAGDNFYVTMGEAAGGAGSVYCVLFVATPRS